MKITNKLEQTLRTLGPHDSVEFIIVFGKEAFRKNAAAFLKSLLERIPGLHTGELIGCLMAATGTRSSIEDLIKQRQVVWLMTPEVLKMLEANIPAHSTNDGKK